MGAELQRAAMICTREDPECHVIYEEGGETCLQIFPPAFTARTQNQQQRAGCMTYVCGAAKSGS